MVAKVLIFYLFVASAVAEHLTANVPWHHVRRKPVALSSSRFDDFDDTVKPIAVPKPVVPQESSVVEKCGQAPLAPNTLSTIVGGKEAIPHSYPWQVGLIDGEDVYFCSGALISDQWIVTAAHCLYHTFYITVVLGAHNIELNEASQATMGSFHIYRHRGWWFGTFGKHEDDIALIKLENKVQFNDYIQPICLPKEDSPEVTDGTNVTVTGWGHTQDIDHHFTRFLHEVTLPVLSNEKCGEFFPDCITDDMICTDGSTKKGPCIGDSGAPMNYKTESGFELRGIAAFGSTLGCEKGKPSAFTRVSHYVKWIREKTGLDI